MDFRIEVKRLPDALAKLEELDKIAVPQEMWLSAEERNILQNASEGLAVLILEGEKIIAGGYGLPADNVEDFLKVVDPEFSAQSDEAYIFSVAVAPDVRRRHLGTMVRVRLAAELKNAGFKVGSSHIKMSNEWHRAGRVTYCPSEVRIVKDYWHGAEYPDVEFQRFKL